MQRQLVLLCDLGCLGGGGGSEGVFELRLRCLQRAALRVLLRHANPLQSGGALRWGYRLFDSRYDKPGTDRSGFVDFSADSFEAFENSLEGALERRQSMSPVQTPAEGRAGRAVVRALQEVLFDFQWERAALESPIKRPRGRRCVAPPPVANDAGNDVYLVMALPATVEEAAVGFTESGAAAPALGGRLTSALLSEPLRALLCDRCRVRLHVLDTAALCGAAPEPAVAAAFSQLMAATGGGVCPLPELVTVPALAADALAAPESAAEGVLSPGVQQRRCRLRMGVAEADVRLTLPEKADMSADSALSCRLPEEGTVVGLSPAAKVTHVEAVRHPVLLYMEAEGDIFSTGHTLLVRWGGRWCLLHAISARAAQLLTVTPAAESAPADGAPAAADGAPAAADGAPAPADGAPAPTDGASAPADGAPAAADGAPAPTDGAPAPADGVPSPAATAHSLSADMLQMWYLSSWLQNLGTAHNPSVQEPWTEERRRLLSAAMRASPAAAPAATRTTEQATAPAGRLQRGRQMMARAAHLAAARARHGARQQQAELRRQTGRRVERERRMREQQQRALRDVGGVTDPTELLQKLQEMKEACVRQPEQEMVAAVQSVINTLLLHIKTDASGVDMAGRLREMVRQHFLPEKAQVMLRYGDNMQGRVREYMYQILLLLEMSWVLGGEVCEDDCDQLVDLLRLISLHGGASTMTEFMEEVLVESYQHTQPEVLLQLHEELSRPPPAALLQLVSPQRSVSGGSGSQAPPSCASLLSATSGPGSHALPFTRNSSLTRQASLLEASRKLKILVPKLREVGRHQSNSSSSSRSLSLVSAAAARARAVASGSKTGSGARPTSGAKLGSGVGPGSGAKQGTGAKLGSGAKHGSGAKQGSGGKHSQRRSAAAGRVKRNLFESAGGDATSSGCGAEARTPPQRHSAAAGARTPPQRAAASALDSSFVPETPAAARWRPARRLSSRSPSAGDVTAGDVTVVTESPEAQRSDAGDGLTPRRASHRLTLTRRASFYNSEDGSRHFSRARSQLMADRLRRSAPVPAAAPTEGDQPLISRLFGHRTDSAESSSSLHWGLDAISPVRSQGADDAQAPTPARVQTSPQTPVRRQLSQSGTPRLGSRSRSETPGRRVQFDLTPAKTAARAARGATPRSILKAASSAAGASPDLFATPQKRGVRLASQRKRLFSGSPVRPEPGWSPLKAVNRQQPPVEAERRSGGADTDGARVEEAALQSPRQGSGDANGSGRHRGATQENVDTPRKSPRTPRGELQTPRRRLLLSRGASASPARPLPEPASTQHPVPAAPDARTPVKSPESREPQTPASGGPSQTPSIQDVENQANWENDSPPPSPVVSRRSVDRTPRSVRSDRSGSCPPLPRTPTHQRATPQTPVSSHTPQPGTPQTPASSHTPQRATPQTPATPHTRAIPRTPATPRTPTTPQTPATSHTPQPTTPQTPATYQTPQPASPQTPPPASPQTPATSHTPQPANPQTPPPASPQTPPPASPQTPPPASPQTPPPASPQTPPPASPQTLAMYQRPGPATPQTSRSPASSPVKLELLGNAELELSSPKRHGAIRSAPGEAVPSPAQPDGESGCSSDPGGDDDVAVPLPDATHTSPDISVMEDEQLGSAINTQLGAVTSMLLSDLALMSEAALTSDAAVSSASTAASEPVLTSDVPRASDAGVISEAVLKSDTVLTSDAAARETGTEPARTDAPVSSDTTRLETPLRPQPPLLSSTPAQFHGWTPLTDSWRFSPGGQDYLLVPSPEFSANISQLIDTLEMDSEQSGVGAGDISSAGAASGREALPSTGVECDSESSLKLSECSVLLSPLRDSVLEGCWRESSQRLVRCSGSDKSSDQAGDARKTARARDGSARPSPALLAASGETKKGQRRFRTRMSASSSPPQARSLNKKLGRQDRSSVTTSSGRSGQDSSEVVEDSFPMNSTGEGSGLAARLLTCSAEERVSVGREPSTSESNVECEAASPTLSVSPKKIVRTAAGSWKMLPKSSGWPVSPPALELATESVAGRAVLDPPTLSPQPRPVTARPTIRCPLSPKPRSPKLASAAEGRASSTRTAGGGSNSSSEDVSGVETDPALAARLAEVTREILRDILDSTGSASGGSPDTRERKPVFSDGRPESASPNRRSRFSGVESQPDGNGAAGEPSTSGPWWRRKARDPEVALPSGADGDTGNVQNHKTDRKTCSLRRTNRPRPRSRAAAAARESTPDGSDVVLWSSPIRPSSAVRDRAGGPSPSPLTPDRRANRRLTLVHSDDEDDADGALPNAPLQRSLTSPVRKKRPLSSPEMPLGRRGGEPLGHPQKPSHESAGPSVVDGDGDTGWSVTSDDGQENIPDNVGETRDQPSEYKTRKRRRKLSHGVNDTSQSLLEEHSTGQRNVSENVSETVERTSKSKKRKKKKEPHQVANGPQPSLSQLSRVPPLPDDAVFWSQQETGENAAASYSVSDAPILQPDAEDHAAERRRHKDKGRKRKRAGGDLSGASTSEPDAPAVEPRDAGSSRQAARPVAPLRTPPPQRVTRTRIGDMGLSLADVEALAVSPAVRRSPPTSRRLLTPPSALSLLQLTTSPIVSPVMPPPPAGKRCRRTLHR